MNPVLQLKNVTVRTNTIALLENINFTLNKGQTLGIVGESGSGKSMTALTIMRLLPDNISMDSGEILFGKTNLISLSESRMRTIRGRKIAMIFQNPQAAFNPIQKIGAQMDEIIRAHFNENKRQRKARARKYLNEAELSQIDSILAAYPFQLSGGMLQRVLIAMALSLQPQVLIADEPTTALDVVIQAQIIQLLQKIQQKNKMAMIMISHDLDLVARLTHHIIVLYGGRIVEYGQTENIIKSPLHPYTKALIKSKPSLKPKKGRLHIIPGAPPPAGAFAEHCKFAPRCPEKKKICFEQVPMLKEVRGSSVACFLYDEVRNE